MHDTTWSFALTILEPAQELKSELLIADRSLLDTDYQLDLGS